MINNIIRNSIRIIAKIIGIALISYGFQSGFNMLTIIGIMLFTFGELFTVKSLTRSTPVDNENFVKTQPVQDNKEQVSLDQEYFDTILKYATELGYAATLQVTVDNNGINHFWVVNTLSDADGFNTRYEKLVEVMMIDETIKSGSNEFNSLIEQTKENLNKYQKEHK
jgi:hypothetical protein